MRAFASDNYAGVHPDVLAAIAEANVDHAVSYGDDPWTARAHDVLRRHLGDDAQPWLVFNGTAANVLGLGAVARTWEAVISPRTAHLEVDEAGAPERMAGVKMLTVPTPDGKLRPGDITPYLSKVGDEHASQPRVVSIANATELGRSTPSPRSARSPTPRTSTTCSCTSTARGSRTPPSRSARRSATSPRRWGRTSSPSASRRTARSASRPSCS